MGGRLQMVEFFAPGVQAGYNFYSTLLYTQYTLPYIYLVVLTVTDAISYGSFELCCHEP